MNALTAIELDAELDISFSTSAKESASLKFDKLNPEDNSLFVLQHFAENHYLRISKRYLTLGEAVSKFETLNRSTNLNNKLLEHYCSVPMRHEFDRFAEYWNGLYPYSDMMFSAMYKDAQNQFCLYTENESCPPLPATILGFEDNDYHEIYLDLARQGPQNFLEARSNAGQKFLRNALGSKANQFEFWDGTYSCLLYTSPSPRDRQKSRMPSSA